MDLYKKAKRGQDSAPRLGELCQELERIERAAGELAELLEDSDSILRKEIDTQALAGDYRDELKAFIASCLSPSTAPSGLRLLLGAARDSRQRLVWVEGSGDPLQPDSGGQRNLFVQWKGSARRALVTYCAFTYADFHGADAVTHGSKGNFQRFVVAVWKAAGEKEERLSPRMLREELHDILPFVKRLLGTREPGVRNARSVVFGAFAAGLRAPERDKRSG